MVIRTKEDVKQFLKNFESLFVLRKKHGFAYFPIAFRGYFGNYAMIYYNYESGEWKVSYASKEIVGKEDTTEIEKFIWSKRDEINYTLSKTSNCTCPECNEDRWYAVGPSYRGDLKRALCSSCLHSFKLDKEVEDVYYTFPSM